MTVRRPRLSGRARARAAAVLGVAVASVLIAVGAAGLGTDVLPFRGWAAGAPRPTPAGAAGRGPEFWPSGGGGAGAPRPAASPVPELQPPAPQRTDTKTAGGSPAPPSAAPVAPGRAPLGPVAGIVPTAPV